MRTPRVSSLLKEYFEHEAVSKYVPYEFQADHRHLPISAKTESKWFVKQAPERLCRTYEFPSRGEARYFINELMDYEDRQNHHAEIKCKGPVVNIEVYTHGVDCVTELDKEYANESELIYDDVCSYGYR